MDLYADLEGDMNNGKSNQEEMESVDLYEDILVATPTPGALGPRQGPPSFQPNDHRKHQLYIGNLTWWTSDRDIANAIMAVGIRDLLEVKFFEYRPNGQSKGYCTVSFGSENSVQMCLDGLPKTLLHGNRPVVTYHTKEAQLQFEASCKARPSQPNTNNYHQSAAINSSVFAPIGNAGMPMPPNMLGHNRPPPHWHGGHPQSLAPPVRPPPLDTRAPPPRLTWNGPPPGSPHVPHNFSPRAGPVPVNRPPPSYPPPNLQPGPPGYVPRHTPPRPLYRPSVPPPDYNPMPRNGVDNYPPDARREYNAGPPPITPNLEEIMTRNRTVTSSAIDRAVSDAAAGEYASAIETLVTAISLIKHSEVSRDDRCRVLISSLQETLQKVEAKSYGSSRRERSRSRDRDRLYRRYRRDRSRSRERDFRERSRERDRDRDRYYYEYRDRSRSRGREKSRDDKYYEERERYRERERERDSKKEHDRERDYRRESEREREGGRKEQGERERGADREPRDRDRDREPRRESEREPSRRELERERREPDKDRRDLEMDRETSQREPGDKESSSRRDRGDGEKDGGSRRETTSRRDRESDRERETSRRGDQDWERDRGEMRREREQRRESDREKYYKVSEKDDSYTRDPKQV